MRRWRSPVTGAELAAEGPHALVAKGERWPIVDNIPYLRTGRERLIGEVFEYLDADEETGALTLLLADADDWWNEPPPPHGELRTLIAEIDGLSLREAMARLGFGRVGDYFAYRWSDPTYLASLALLEAHWNAPESAFELACGVGHYLRDLTRRGVACLGADVVFAKCWLARRFVAPHADYVVFDASSPWPLADERFDLVMCHDAFYFLPDQEQVAANLRDHAATDGGLAISHLHNLDWHREPLGPARTAAFWRGLFPDAQVYDEKELRQALWHQRAPRQCAWAVDAGVEAWSLFEGDIAAQPVTHGIAMPPEDAALRRNPLLGETSGDVRWPSPDYEREYADGCLWARTDADLPPGADPVRTRRIVDLPERW
ncbi:MAG: methyltransferase domain-containing protein [Pacificimonas sp.]